jgi:DNA (cytosine-5)-methyltransferase 1
MEDVTIRTLDLFSGIGGFAWGLRGVARVVGYCDTDAACRDVLADNIRRGRLDDAPIFEDITMMTEADMDALLPELVTAGFPCQDISCANPRAVGIHGSRSRLFFDVIRLVRDCHSVRYVLLENSVCIKSRGGAEVLASLQSVGFRSIAISTFTAEEVGALHQRRRWFCLATRTTTTTTEPPPIDLEMLKRNMRFQWHERVDHVVPRPSTTDFAKRIEGATSMFGNAVVPECVAYAFLALWTALAEGVGRTGINVDQPSTRGTSSAVVTLVTDDGETRRVMKKIPFPLQFHSIDNIEEELVVNLVHPQDPTRVVYSARRWTTPTTTRIGQTSLEKRNHLLFGNQVYYDQKTWDEIQEKYPGRTQRPRDVYGSFLINPRFTESLMGYPQDWVTVQAAGGSDAVISQTPTTPREGTQGKRSTQNAPKY